jgi:hypothetical protein
VQRLSVTLLIGWVVMQPFRIKAIAAYQATLLADVTVDQPIELHGHVRIERPNFYSEPDCDYLCLTALDSPGVQSVTTVTKGKRKPSQQPQTSAYELVVDNQAPAGLFPIKPGQIVREYRPLVQSHRGKEFITAIKAVEADWAVRLADLERLRRTNPVAAEQADWVIRIENETTYPTSVLRRVTILDSQGNVRFRRSYRKQAVPTPIFYLGFHFNMGAGTISGESFHIGRTILQFGDHSLKPESTLLEAIKFPVPFCDARSLARLRKHVQETLGDPDASPASVDSMRQYLGLFFFDTTKQDHEFISRIVADDRVREIDQHIANVFAKDKTPIVMRDAYAKRIVMEHTSASLRHWLAVRLASMPAGTFANPSTDHLAIWNTPDLYRDAGPFAAAIADLAPNVAVTKLTEMLETAIGVHPWNERRALVEGIRAALISPWA